MSRLNPLSIMSGVTPPAAAAGVPAAPAPAASMPAAGGIGGALPWNQAQGGGSLTDYSGAYNSSLKMNEANYNNILAGYQNTMSNQTSAQDAIQKGYGDLYNNVLGKIQGVEASQRQAIADSYGYEAGSTTQGAINRGLNNTTVLNSLQRGLTLDRQKADIALSNQSAQLQAGYMSNLGLAGLGFQNQANQQNAQLANQQLGFMNSVTAGYPNPQTYANLAQQYGAGLQGQRDQQQAQDLGNRLMGAGAAGLAPTGQNVSGLLGQTGNRNMAPTYGDNSIAGLAGAGFGQLQLPDAKAGAGAGSSALYSGAAGGGGSSWADLASGLYGGNNDFRGGGGESYGGGWDAPASGNDFYDDWSNYYG